MLFESPPLPKIEVKNYQYAEIFDSCFRLFDKSDYFVCLTSNSTSITMSARCDAKRKMYIFFCQDQTSYSIDDIKTGEVIERGDLTEDHMHLLIDKLQAYLDNLSYEMEEARAADSINNNSVWNTVLNVIVVSLIIYFIFIG